MITISKYKVPLKAYLQLLCLEPWGFGMTIVGFLMEKDMIQSHDIAAASCFSFLLLLAQSLALLGTFSEYLSFFRWGFVDKLTGNLKVKRKDVLKLLSFTVLLWGTICAVFLLVR